MPTSSRTHTATAPTVMVVDDDALTRLLVTNILNDHGICAIPATCAKEALSIMDDLDNKPNLIISDILMPDMTGFEMLQTIKEQHCPIKTLFITGSSSHAGDWHYTDNVQTPVLMKPFRKSELLTHVSRILELPHLIKCNNPA